MRRVIPNTDPVGNDLCLSPIAVNVPMVIVDNGCECFWYHDTMDRSSADRMTFAMRHSLGAEAFRVDIKMIVPAASDIRAATAELDELACDPLRVILRID